MKPMKVIEGEKAPDLDELIEKANNMDEMLQKVADLRDDSQLRNITGVEEARMSHYWTNQDEVETGIENVQNRGAHSETINFDETANPHQTGSTLSAHENTAGGELKKSVGVKKAGMPMPPPGPPGGGDDMGAGGEDEAGLAALLGGLGGDEGGSDLPKDPAAIAEMLAGLGKNVKALAAGGADDMPPPDMPMGGDEEQGEGPPTLPI